MGWLRDMEARLPRGVRVLLVLNIGASLVIWLAMGLQAVTGMSIQWSMDLFALPADPMRFMHRPWTLATYMIAQANPFQLLFNLLWLCWFGTILDTGGSSRTLLSAYTGGGAAGGVLYLAAGALAPGSGTVLLGSSAAVLSVMVLTALRHPDMPVGLWLIGEVKLKWVAVFTVCITLLGGMGLAAHCAHLGGILYPVATAALQRMSRRRSVPRHHMPEALKRGPIVSPADDGSDSEELLDELLDKIRVSGFGSLSENEKKTLDRVSRTLK